MAIDVNAVSAYIRQSALQRGIDPDIALRVARSEGLAPGVWQSNVINRQGNRETSYGPFQLLTGGGLGDAFIKQTGLDIKDPSTVNAQVDFALDQAKKGGWGPWYGAAKVGVGNWDGLNGTPQMAQADGPKGQEAYPKILQTTAQGSAEVMGPPMPNAPNGLLNNPTAADVAKLDPASMGDRFSGDQLTALLGLLNPQGQQQQQPVAMQPAAVGGGQFKGLPQALSLLPRRFT